ncbi:MAG: methyltransferase domain-containing protein [Cellvibrionaceae bacterium]|nr:methyltransferase domain-containing protein [Cellvibrionaceae bacterium]MCV6625941.1 methyltransferase domain-containing protein [Cellvibrionaceae bacterium]
MSQAALQTEFAKSRERLPQSHATLEMSPAQWQMVNKLLQKCSRCYGRTLELGLSQEQVAQLRQRCKDYCRHILNIYPECADALALLSRIALDCNELGKAHRLIEQALQYAPKSSVCWFSLGHIYLAEGKHKQARECFQQTVILDPNHFRAKAAYAYSHLNQGDIVPAFNIYKRLIWQNPEDPHVKTNLFNCLKQLTADGDNKDLDEQLKYYLSLDDVDHSDLAGLLASLLEHRYQLNDDNSQVDIARLCKDKLYLQGLQVLIFSAPSIEDLNSSVREHLLYASHCNLDELNLKVCLAMQGYNNEHVIAYDDTERLFIESRLQQSENLIKRQQLSTQEQLTLLDNWVSLVMYEPAIVFKALYNGNLLNHLLDTAASINDGDELLNNLGKLLKRSFHSGDDKCEFKKLGTISDSISCKVKAQYEENPYPRWLALPYQSPSVYQDALDTALPEHGFSLRPGQKTIEVLVAGCGTGKHALQCARYFRNTRVTAIDISHSSLAYAKSMADHYELHNIEFIQADILELEQLNQQFDIIECSGVLHHMHSPLQGARVLKSLLRPGGLMKIGLYSERARAEVVQCRSRIREQGLSTSAKDMRELRRQLLSQAEQWPSIMASPDFYNLSGCRDLLFHAQEHRFTPLQLRDFCDDLGVDFLGFVRVQNAHLQAYRNTYPLDTQCNNLDYWEAFESRNPSTFGTMYQFYVRKN